MKNWLNFIGVMFYILTVLIFIRWIQTMHLNFSDITFICALLSSIHGTVALGLGAIVEDNKETK